MKRYLCLLLFLFTPLVKPLAKNYVGFGPENPPEGPRLPARARLVNSSLLSEQERRRVAIEIINEQIRLSASQRRHSSSYPTEQSQPHNHPSRTPGHLRLRRFAQMGRSNPGRQHHNSHLARRTTDTTPRNLIGEFE